MINRPKAKASPGIACGSIAIVSIACLPGSRVRTTTQETMKLKNKTKMEVVNTKTNVFCTISNPPTRKKMSRYHCKLTKDSASIDGMRTDGSRDSQTNTRRGKNTARVMYTSTNTKPTDLNLPRSWIFGLYPFPVTTA